MESKGLQVVQSGERTNTEGKPVSNLILLSLSDSDYNSLRPHLEYISLPNHLVLHEGGGRLEFACFPNRGLISLVVVMKDGRTAEAGIVGNEGFTGTPAAVGLSRSPLQAVVQITGDGFRVPDRDNALSHHESQRYPVDPIPILILGRGEPYLGCRHPQCICVLAIRP